MVWNPATQGLRSMCVCVCTHIHFKLRVYHASIVQYNFIYNMLHKLKKLTSPSVAVRGTDPTKSLAKLPPSKRSKKTNLNLLQY